MKTINIKISCSNIILAPCGMGNFFLDGLCRKCEYGFYQDELGQIGCKQCPPGMTTPGRASRGAESCSGKDFFTHIFFKKILRERALCMYYMYNLIKILLVGYFFKIRVSYSNIYLSVKMILEEDYSK